MKKQKRKTAGELSRKVAADNTKYDLLEVGHELTHDVVEQLRICAERHDKIFNEDQFCVILMIASDPLIQGVRRHKYYASLFLPMPRPQQTVFLYKKADQSFKRLWSMPDAKVMATLSEMGYVAPRWQLTQGWCKAFFNGWKYNAHDDKWTNTTPNHFFNFIRKQHNISMPSETEYLNIHREELIKAGAKNVDSTFSEPFDFSKVAINKIVDTKTALSDEDILDSSGKTEDRNRNIAPHKEKNLSIIS